MNFFDLFLHLGLNLFQALLHLFGADDIVTGREDGNMLDHVLLGAREGVELGDAVDLVAEELHPDGQLAHISQIDVHDVAVDAELIADEIDIVALILQRHQLFTQLVPFHLHPGPQADDHAAVIDGVTQRVDTGHRCHNDDIPPLRKRRRGRVAQAVDLIVDGAVLFNVGIGAWDVGFGLVIIVVGNKILHRIVREERAELGAELGRQRLIMGQHQRGAVAPGRSRWHGKGLAAAGHTQQGLAAVARSTPFTSVSMALRLVAGGLVRGYQFKFFVCHLPSPLRPSRKEPQSVVFYGLYYSTPVL